MVSSHKIGNSRAGLPIAISSEVGWELILLRVLLCVSPLLLCQCKSVEGTNTGGPTEAIALGTPITLSGNTGRDALALGGSNQIIQLADWGRMSAGQNWSKIFGKHQVYGEKGFTAKAAPPPAGCGTFRPSIDRTARCRSTIVLSTLAE